MTESASAIDLSSIDVKGALDSMYVSKEDRVLDPTKADASLIERMPSPTGWRMLILPYRGKGKTAGGVYLPDKVVDDGQLTTVVGYVMKQGPLCYKDETKFRTARGARPAIGSSLPVMLDRVFALRAARSAF
jgi:hypothetical protein